MTVKEIFDHPAVKAVEMEILDTIRDEERCRSCRNGEDTRLAVQHLLSVRKRIINGMFEWTDEHFSLLSEFNNALVHAQCEMRERLSRLSESVNETGLENLEFQGEGIHELQVFRDSSCTKRQGNEDVECFKWKLR